ncbi:spermine oxidase [Gracilaria domingensis]|nr:spermine oxidase [Gracilaria domingensis]
MSPTDGPRVAIVGAGLAGLATAARLLQRYAIVATVFESQSRVGGRVHSVTAESSSHHLSLVLDLGATWFHGTHGNAAYDAVVQSGALKPLESKEGADEQWEAEDGVLLFSTPAVVVGQGVAKTVSPERVLPIVRAYAAALEKIEDADACRVDQERVDESVMQFVRRSTDFDNMTQFDRAVFNARDALEACISGCDSSTADFSTIGYADYVTLKGNNVLPDGGMRAVVDAFVDVLDESQIHLSRAVVRVAYGDEENGTARITLEDGDVWEGDCIVWTPSINVTKVAVAKGVFEPCVPNEKIAAMTERVLGIVEKVFVLLNAPLESVPSDCGLPVIWEDIEAVHESQKWWTNVYSVLYSSKHCMVQFWLTGDAAKHVSSLSDELRSQQIESLLAVLYSQSVAIEKVICSEWSLNQSTLGSYSYPKVGCSKNAVRTLAQPLPSVDRPLLCFAGEATHQSYFSTMHGAVESGYREADRIAAFWNQGSRLKP